jgi:hypothetical protein
LIFTQGPGAARPPNYLPLPKVQALAKSRDRRRVKPACATRQPRAELPTEKAHPHARYSGTVYDVALECRDLTAVEVGNGPRLAHEFTISRLHATTDLSTVTAVKLFYPSTSCAEGRQPVATIGRVWGYRSVATAEHAVPATEARHTSAVRPDVRM